MSEPRPSVVYASLTLGGIAILLGFLDAPNWSYLAAIAFAAFIGWKYEEDAKKKKSD